MQYCCVSICFVIFVDTNIISMDQTNTYDVIIIGGSYAGLSAGMSLGRAMRNTLIIDGGKPCNQQTPHSHNFLTRDGETPAEIGRKAKEQVSKYTSVRFLEDEVTDVSGENNNFEVRTASGRKLHAAKLLFATGLRDTMPSILGFPDCWGISVIHCPYCHGYEYSFEKTGIMSNGAMAFEYAKLINNWTRELTIFTNGKSEIDAEHTAKLKAKNIEVIETEITEVRHDQGKLQAIVFKDGTEFELTALYNRPCFKQHCEIPEKLGCALTEHGYIAVDDFKKTSVAGIYAAGDNTTPMRSVAGAVAAGTVAASCINHELVDDRF